MRSADHQQGDCRVSELLNVDHRATVPILKIFCCYKQNNKCIEFMKLIFTESNQQRHCSTPANVPYFGRKFFFDCVLILSF